MVRRARSKHFSIANVKDNVFIESPCLRRLARPLSSPLGTTCLNHILEKIIPGMKVLLLPPLLPPVH